MKSKEIIEAMISQSEQSLKVILKDIEECDNLDFLQLLIDRKHKEQTTISTLKWVLKK